jgi:dipeptidyl aminopeptidase/acylaminoacyl peptidase
VVPALAGLLLGACGDVMSPLRKLGEPGKDPYVVFVAMAANNATDLYVARPDGKDVRPVTYSPTWELAPRLSSDGAVLAYLRAADTLAATPRQLWVTNMLNGAERKLDVPADAQLSAVAWSEDGAQVLARGRTAAGQEVLFAWPMPPQSGVQPTTLEGAARAAALSRFDERLGEPAFARVVPCEAGTRFSCVEVLDDTVSARRPVADVPVTHAARWRGDSVIYVIGDSSVRIRPLGAGRERRMEWGPKIPIHPQDFTLFPGQATR